MKLTTMDLIKVNCGQNKQTFLIYIYNKIKTHFKFIDDIPVNLKNYMYL